MVGIIFPKSAAVQHSKRNYYAIDSLEIRAAGSIILIAQGANKLNSRVQPLAYVEGAIGSQCAYGPDTLLAQSIILFNPLHNADWNGSYLVNFRDEKLFMPAQTGADHVIQLNIADMISEHLSERLDPSDFGYNHIIFVCGNQFILDNMSSNDRISKIKIGGPESVMYHILNEYKRAVSNLRSP